MRVEELQQQNRAAIQQAQSMCICNPIAISDHEPSGCRLDRPEGTTRNRSVVSCGMDTRWAR
jgi:hypothetical protein